MKPTISLLITLALVVVGCRKSDPDREPYTRRILWQDANVVNHSETNAYRFITVEPGSNLVAEIRDGFYRGKQTSIHSSHVSVYLIFDREPRAVRTYRFSFRDGTLDFDGFAGYSLHVLNTNMPAVAELDVTDVTPTEVTGELRVSLHSYPREPKPGEYSRLLVWNEKVTLERKNINTDCRTMPCCVRR